MTKKLVAIHKYIISRAVSERYPWSGVRFNVSLSGDKRTGYYLMLAPQKR